MATQIQEPQELEHNEITDQNAQFYDILVYKKDPNLAGIKTLNCAEWKSFLGYNEHKADNIADFIGIDPLTYDISAPNPTVPSPGTVLEQIDNIADKVGIDLTTPAPSDPTQTTNGKLITLDHTVNGYEEGGVHVDGLVDTTDELADRISDLEDEVGGGGGTPGDNLFTRMGNAETDITALQHSVDGYDEGDPAVHHKGLLERATEIENILGTPASGSYLEQTDVSTLCEANYQQLNASSTGIAGRLTTAEADVSTLQGQMVSAISDISTAQTDIGNIQTDLSTLQTTVNDPSTGLVKEVSDLKQSMTTVYNVQGNLDQATASAWTNSDFQGFKTGDVWNISVGAGNSITINVPKTSSTTETQTFYNGANILWIEDTTNYLYGYFDELGTAIDVTRISTLETEVNNLDTRVEVIENKYQTDNNAANHWTSGDGVSTGLGGRYIITADCNSPTSTAIFYMKFSGNGVCMINETKNMGGDTQLWSSYFTQDPSRGFITALYSTNYVSVMKIGD